MISRVAITWCVGLWAAHALAGQPARTQPSFVFILADDLGCRDLSGEGSTFYESPRIDSIAEGGMRFQQGYATCQVCSPSRASIMTGKYPARIGITDWIGAASGTDWKRNDRLLPADYRRHLPHEETTIAEALKLAGYATFFAGKWHLGGKGSLPEDHGFEINKGGFHVGSPPGGYFSPYTNPKLENRQPGESLPIRLAEETVAFIEANRDRPFFAFLSFYSVHGPIQTTHSLWNKYRAKFARQLPGRSPPSGPLDRFLIDRTLPVRQVQDNPVYAGMVESMDQAVGLVLDALEKQGLTENTVVVFTSDNGGVSSGDAYSTSNLPYRGGKGRQWEGGIREPYYLRVPGVTRPGSTCDTPVTGTDFFPTILELAGLESMPQQHVDGVSLVPLLKGQPGSVLAERALYWHYPHYGNQGGEPSSIIREGNWKMIHYWEDGRNELYRLDQDPGEQQDLSGNYPDRVILLWHQLQSWLDSVEARIPQPDERFDEKKKLEQLRRIETSMKKQLEQRHAAYLDDTWIPNKTWWGSQPDENLRSIPVAP